MSKEKENQLSIEDFIIDNDLNGYQEFDVLDNSANTEFKSEEESELKETGGKEELDTPIVQTQEEDEDIVEPALQLLYDKFGWDFDKGEVEEYVGKGVDGIVNFMSDLIKENSKPEYSSETVALFDEYVKKGGNPKEFISTYYNEVNYSEIDLSVEKNQILVNRKALALQGFDDDDINDMIDDYIDADILEKQANKNLKIVIKNEDNKKQEILSRQQKEIEQRQNEYSNYLENNKKKIFEAKEIAGFELDTKDKEKFYKWAFEKDSKGMTGYDKFYQSTENSELQLLMLAYKGLNKKENLDKIAVSEATKKFKNNISRYKDTTVGNSKIDVKVQNPKINLDDFVI